MLQVVLFSVHIIRWHECTWCIQGCVCFIVVGHTVQPDKDAQNGSCSRLKTAHSLYMYGMCFTPLPNISQNEHHPVDWFYGGLLCSSYKEPTYIICQNEAHTYESNRAIKPRISILKVQVFCHLTLYKPFKWTSVMLCFFTVILPILVGIMSHSILHGLILWVYPTPLRGCMIWHAGTHS